MNHSVLGMGKREEDVVTIPFLHPQHQRIAPVSSGPDQAVTVLHGEALYLLGLLGLLRSPGSPGSAREADDRPGACVRHRPAAGPRMGLGCSLSHGGSGELQGCSLSSAGRFASACLASKMCILAKAGGDSFINNSCPPFMC